MIGVRIDAEVLLHGRDDLLEQVSGKEREIADAGCAHRRHDCEGADRGALYGVTVRHDHHHRHGFAVRDEVVEDDVGAAARHPSALGFAVAMKEIVDRVFRLRLVVVGRRVHPHVAVHAHRLRFIENDAHFAVRNGTRIVECGAVAGTSTKLKATSPADRGSTLMLAGSGRSTPSIRKL